MSRFVDFIIVGAGPAGMSAAILARRYGLDVLVVDEQPTPGGQIWRGVEVVANTPRADILGKAYIKGGDVVRQFRASGVEYLPETRVWQIESGPCVFMTHNGAASSVKASALLLATGAQERPVPFPGWTTPGVMTVGAGQIVLKSSGQIPAEPVWIAGSGPLPLLYAVQLLQAGGQIAGFLDTTPAGQMLSAMPKFFAAALSAPADVLKGIYWLATLKKQTNYVRNVTDIEAIGDDMLKQLRYVTANGKTTTVEANLLLVHEGIVPTIHPTLALGCEHIWNADQDSFAPELDTWGETSEAGVFVAGDGAGIGGASIACLRGEISALRIVVKAGRLSEKEGLAAMQPIQAKLKRALRARPFLDKLYRPRKAIFMPEGKTLVCRCEEVSASSIRDQAALGSLEPNSIKAFTRAGMGPCQGRQCNYPVAHILADAAGKTVPDIGLYRVRPPFKPLTLSELKTLNTPSIDTHSLKRKGGN
jgi:NADPH-dependent 2,4-dienoyl-CoA reductase/sulfur reductase-like enzyme